MKRTISYKQCGVKQELLLNKLERALRIEMANALSHGIGIILILAFSPLLFLKAHSSGIEYLPEAVSLYVFGL